MLLHTLSDHTDCVNAVKFYNKKIISGSDDKTIRIWDGKSNRIVADQRIEEENRIAELTPIVTKWFEKTNGDSELLLAMLDREAKKRSPEEVNTLRNIVLKRLVNLNQ